LYPKYPPPTPKPTNPSGAIVTKTPVAPKDVKVAKSDPAATFPIAAWVAAAADPAAIPEVENPASVAATPVAVVTPPTVVVEATAMSVFDHPAPVLSL
jgi:hypothetical protein